METQSAHLTFCTNIFAGETWADHFAALKANFPAIKTALSYNQPMGIGLRLSNIASMEILENDYLTQFKTWLSNNDAYVFTMNGFPYGGFHHTRVKDQVHAPDWTTTDRLNYTLRLFNILAQLLPARMDGGISTAPLSYKPWFNEQGRIEATAIATQNIIAAAKELDSIYQSTGILMHLDIEPEPDGFLESGREFIDWFENNLLPAGKNQLSEEAIKRHINLCYDVCHFAIGYEPHAEIIAELHTKGIKTGKIQISAALKSLLPSSPIERSLIIDGISKYNEPTYLHQVIAKAKDGSLTRYSDLPQALADSQNPDITEWRAHFHVPVFVEDMGLIQSTQADIVEVLNIFNKQPFTQHLEVETYTWAVLPEQLKAPLDRSIIRELEWVRDRLG
jgi:hypothetical protein